MTKTEKKTVLDCITAVAWADGNLSKDEKDEISRIAKNIGGFDKKEIEKLLSQKITIEPVLNKLREFNSVVGGKILNFCYRLAIADNKIHKNEIEVIKKIAGQFWPQEELDDVLKWLKKTYEAEQLYFRLFLVPQMEEKS
jgi:uncharacterized tellurite resistance protein B-like protein